MSHPRQAQWSQRIQRILALRARFTKAGQYERADKAYRVAQHVYDQWADEVFQAVRSR